MEKRIHQRMAIKNLFVDASDGVGFFQGDISDVSRFGISINGLSRKVDGKTKKMTIIVSGLGKNFKMSIHPRWSHLAGSEKTIGAEIPNPPWGWTEFIMQHEQPLDDIWGTVNI